MECEFCKTMEEGPYNVNCKVCGFPIHGTEQEQKDFEASHAELKMLIDRSESTLSWARFLMFWPWISGVIFGFIYFVIMKKEDLQALGLGIFGAIFIASYFLVRWKPIPILILDFSLLFLATIAGSYFTWNILGTLNFLQSLIIPSIFLLVFGNACFLQWKVQRALGEMMQNRFRKP